MKTEKLIARKIEKALGFTNGWCIEQDRYTDICNRLAKEIIKIMENKI